MLAGRYAINDASAGAYPTDVQLSTGISTGHSDVAERQRQQLRTAGSPLSIQWWLLTFLLQA